MLARVLGQYGEATVPGSPAAPGAGIPGLGGSPAPAGPPPPAPGSSAEIVDEIVATSRDEVTQLREIAANTARSNNILTGLTQRIDRGVTVYQVTT